jgi:gliding motility-associated lipoprotein GldJ
MKNLVINRSKFYKVMNIKPFKNLCLALLGLALVYSCAKDRSTSTGWNYNDYQNGGFEKFDAKEQETGPGLVLVEGGTFTMGQTEQDVMFDWNARSARVSVASFYMDRTEVTNFHWLEYMYWMKRVYNKSYPHVYKKCLPDTLAWRDPLSYREIC